MRRALSKVPIYALRRFPSSSWVFRPALRTLGRIMAGGSQGEPILFLGDSLTSGAGVDLADAFPAVASRLLGGRRFVNMGVGGETSAQIRARFLAFEDHGRYPAVIWAGRNNWSDPDTVLADIEAMAAGIDGGRFLVLSVIAGTYAEERPGTPGGERIEALNDRLAERYGAHFVEVGSLLDDADRWDQIHLNRAGQAKIARRVAEAIRAAGW
jgi:lysophospholipase L1-like esterase